MILLECCVLILFNESIFFLKYNILRLVYFLNVFCIIYWLINKIYYILGKGVFVIYCLFYSEIFLKC